MDESSLIFQGAYEWKKQNKIKGRLKGISPREVKARLNSGEKPFILDVRGPDEYEQIRLGIGETLIPLGALKKRHGRTKRVIPWC